MADEEDQSQELEDGLYSIRWVTNTNFCMDVAGGADANWANVWNYTYDGSAGQIAYVSKKNNGYVIGFPMTGRVVDLAGGVAVAQQNIQLFPFNDSPAQIWNLIATGDVAAVGGNTYPVYFIQSTSSNHGEDESEEGGSNSGASNVQWCIMAKGAYNGANIIIENQYAEWNSKGRWVFVPVQAVPTGAYKISPYLSSSSVLSVAGHSSANGASCVLEAEVEDSNWQVFKVDQLTDGSCSIRNVQHGHALDLNRSDNAPEPNDGDDVILWPWHAYDNQRWLTRYRGNDSERNGVTLPMYQIVNKFGSAQPTIDVNGYSDAPQSNVVIWTNRYSNAGREAQQSFWFVPTEAYGTDLTVPSSVVGYVDGEYGSLLGTTISSVIYPAWYGTGEEWKVRYRFRTRTVDKANSYRSDWSNWKSLDLGSEVNDGWDVAGYPTANAVMGDGRYLASEGVDFTIGSTGSATDLIDVEFQVKQLVHEWGQFVVDAHSGSASQICTVAYRPSLTINSVTLDHRGAVVSYTSNFNRDGNKIKISVDGMFTCEGSNLPNSGTLSSRTIRSIPSENKQAVVSWQITSIDGVSNYGSVIKTISVDFSGAETMSCTEQFISASHLLRITIPSGSSSSRVWIINSSANDDSIEITSKSQVFYIPYPLTKSFTILAVGVFNGVMKVFKKTYQSRNEITRLWNFDTDSASNNDYCIGTWAIDNLPEESVTTTASNDDRPTTSGGWNRVIIGKTRSQTRNISSVIIDEIDPTGRDRVVRLSKARYAWYRTPEGEVVRVAIVSVSETRRYYGTEFQVEMRRIDEYTRLA